MKKWIKRSLAKTAAAVILLLCAGVTRTQAVDLGNPEVHHAIVNVRDVENQERTGKLKKHKGRFMHEQDADELPPLPMTNPNARHFDNVKFHQQSAPQSIGATPNASTPSSLSPGATNNFLGQSQTGWNPPDTNGAVSPNYVLTTVNNTITIRDRNGNQLSSEDLDNFWLPVQASDNSFDTRARWDPYGQRFIVISGGTLGNAANNHLLIGVSATSDPTGNWHLYTVKTDANNAHWADYPTVGFNKTWIAIGADDFGVTSSDSYTTGLWAFSKADLYNGVASPNIQFLTSPGTATQPAETYDPNQADLFLLTQDSNSSVLLSRLTGPVGSASIVRVGSIAAPSGGSWTGNIPGAPQAGTTVTIGPGINWMMDCCYRNGSIYGTQVVQPTSGPTRTDIQWWKISSTGTLQDVGRVDDPTGTNYYGFGSIAVNKNGDALVGYTQYSATTFPSAGYSFRAAGDAAGTLQSGVIYKNGASAFGQSRWGDYSHTTVDPVDDTTFWTVQEYATSGGGWATWWAEVSPGACTPTAITPYLQVGAGAWQQASTATILQGSVVNLGPQPLMGGTWSWTGSNGFTSTAREIDNIPLNAGTNTYVATYTNASGCASTQTFTITVLVPTPTMTFTPTPVVKSSWRIAAGKSGAYTDCQNNVWAPDSNYNIGNFNSNSNAVTKALPCTTDQALYQSEHWNGLPFAYTFNVPAGSYQVTLKFAEIFDGAAGQRIMNVSINGTQVLTNFDIFADAGGANIADDKVFNNIAPVNGQIVITFAATSGSSDQNAKVDALQIIPQPAPATNTATSTATKVNTATFTATNSATQTATSTVSNSATMTSTATAPFTATRTATSSATVTATRTSTSTLTFTLSPTPTWTPSFTSSWTGTSTWTPSFTPTATVVLTNTATGAATSTGTSTEGNTSTATSTSTLTPVPPKNTATSTATLSFTPTATNSSTPVPPTATNTNTAVNTATSTNTVTSTFTSTPTSTWTKSFTPTATVTNTWTKTFTPVPPTSTATFSFTPTKTNTLVPPTATFTPTKTNTPVPPTATWTRTFTPVPPTATPTSASLCSGVAAWNGNFVAVTIGQKVTYNGELYQCIQSHTTEPNWMPSVVPALWKDLGSCNGSAPVAKTSTVIKSAVAGPNISRNFQPVHFYVQLNQAAQVTVDIFTPLGQRVAGASYFGNAGMNDWLWDVRNASHSVASSGLYVYTVRVTVNGTTEVKTGKIVLLH